MGCQRCGSTRIADVQGKTSDLCFVQLENLRYNDGYVPSGMNIGGGDYLRFSLCLDCGQLQGEFPVTPDTDNWQQDTDISEESESEDNC
jgi:hypothetical protein